MKRRLTNRNFNTFAQMVASPSAPEEYCQAAMKRMMNILHPYMVEVKGVRFEHNARNFVELIDFATEEEAAAYIKAYETYLKQKALLEGTAGGIFILVQFLKFRQAAELIRAPYLAKRAYETQVRTGKSLVIACNFKETIIKIVNILCKDYGVKRDDISLIWGGDTGAKKKKTKTRVEAMTLEEKTALLASFSSPAEREMLKDLGIIDLDDPTFLTEPEVKPVHENWLRLGPQSRIQRQMEIDRFQSDKSKFCLFTFKAGGVGLSLHQHLPTMREREVLITPTYSAMEMVQALGRCARLTSCSDTIQHMIYYRNTIEEEVARSVSQKLKCLTEAVRMKESWQDIIDKGRGMAYVPEGEVLDAEDASSVGEEDEEDEE